MIVIEEYINAKTPILHLHTKCNHQTKMSPSDALAGNGCRICKSKIVGSKYRKTNKQYIKELEIKNPNLLPIEEYVDAKTSILHYHKTCGHQTKMKPTSALRGNGCILCKGLKISKAQAKTHEQFVNELYNKNPNIEVISPYINNSLKIECKCIICGHIWETRAGHLLKLHGCPKCSCKKLADKKRKSHVQFSKELYQVNPYIDITSEYISTHQKINCKCKMCGYQWKASPSKLLIGEGCPSCNESLGERNIRIFLDSKNISYIRFHKYKDLIGVGGGLLSYDFYIPKYNVLIEFQGKQHEYPIDYFGGKETFEKQREHDKRKREYAQKHNINFLEIWYYNIDNVATIIEKFLYNLRSESVETTGVA